MALKQLLTTKQEEVLRSYLNDKWKYLILSGAVRAGKTVIDNYLFLLELRRIRRLADKQGDKHPQYILAGYSSNTIYDNVIAAIDSYFGIDVDTDRHGHYHLFGVDIVPAYTGSVRGLAAIRGMTSYGAYINEASLAAHEVFQEILQRCSVEGARILCDTNPDVPTHWLKTDYIDNHDPKAGVKAFSFTIDDNTFLDPDYVAHLKAIEPQGMFYDRAIKGLWVTAEGVVYQDFDKDTMLVDAAPGGLHYYCGVDWGFAEGHNGVICLFGDDDQGNTYLLEEHTAIHRYIDYWVEVAQDIQRRCGYNVPFWCDSARPEYVSAFQRAGIQARNADKAVLPGIESVAQLMTTKHFFAVQNGLKEFLPEVYQYIWDDKTGEPVKKNDDVMDAMRYAIYNQHQNTGNQVLPNTFI